MTRIDFAFGAPDRLRIACVVTRKRYLAGERVIAYCPNLQRLAQFDRLLWSFDPASFVPHVGAQDALALETPILLSSDAPGPLLDRLSVEATEGQALPWLLNLDDHCAPDIERFARVMEIVSDDDADRQAARNRWRQYAAAGHDLRAHDLKQAKEETA